MTFYSVFILSFLVQTIWLLFFYQTYILVREALGSLIDDETYELFFSSLVVMDYLFDFVLIALTGSFHR